MSVLFIYCFVKNINIYGAYKMNRAIKETFSVYPMSGERYFPDIISKGEASAFISRDYIPPIFDERGKEFQSDNSYHFLNGYNFFVGGRITHNRAAMKTSSVLNKDSEVEIRKKNYKGSTDQTFKSIDKGTFGRHNVMYSSTGGYAGKGGFVRYLKSDERFPNIRQDYLAMIEDGLFDRNMISLTLESIFYNENYRLGIYIVFEFMSTNAGKLEVFTKSNMFQVSHYHLDANEAFPLWTFLLELLYFLLVVWMIYENIK